MFIHQDSVKDSSKWVELEVVLLSDAGKEPSKDSQVALLILTCWGKVLSLPCRFVKSARDGSDPRTSVQWITMCEYLSLKMVDCRNDNQGIAQNLPSLVFPHLFPSAPVTPYPIPSCQSPTLSLPICLVVTVFLSCTALVNLMFPLPLHPCVFSQLS